MDEQINMIKTGIEGLDDLIGGGIPFANQVVLAGGFYNITFLRLRSS